MKIKLLLTFLIFLGFVLINNKVYASDRTVVCKESGCKIDDNSALFKYSNVYPTWSKSKEVKIKNDYPSLMKVYVDISDHNFKNTGFDDVFEIEIKKSGKNIYGPKTLKDFESKGKVSLGTISKDSDKTFEIKVKMKDVGNEYQGKSIKFDLDLKFEAQEVADNTVVSTPVINRVIQQVLGKSTQAEFKKPTVEDNNTSNSQTKKEEIKDQDTGEILGEKDCESNYFWLFTYLLTILLLISLWFFQNNYLKLIVLFTSAISAYFIYLNICDFIFTIFAIALGLLSFLDLKSLLSKES